MLVEVLPLHPAFSCIGVLEIASLPLPFSSPTVPLAEGGGTGPFRKKKGP